MGSLSAVKTNTSIRKDRPKRPTPEPTLLFIWVEFIMGINGIYIAWGMGSHCLGSKTTPSNSCLKLHRHGGHENSTSCWLHGSFQTFGPGDSLLRCTNRTRQDVAAFKCKCNGLLLQLPALIYLISWMLPKVLFTVQSSRLRVEQSGRSVVSWTTAGLEPQPQLAPYNIR